MPKKAGGKKKNGKPEWMSDELFTFSQDPVQLVEGFKGTLDKTAPCANVSKEQAGLLLWKLLFPNDKKTKVKRADALKADVLAVAVKMFGNIEHPVATPAAGIVSVFCLEAETERETALTARPSVLASIYKAIACPSVALITEAARLLRILSVSPDTRARVLKAAKDWDLKILLSACSLKRFIGTHGARIAGIECMNVLAALAATSSPEGEEPYSAQEVATSAAFQRALLAADGLEIILGVARSNGPPASAGFAATILHELFRTIGPDLCAPFAATGGVPAMVRILQNTYVSLPQHAAAAGTLWYFLVPDQRLMIATGGCKGASAQLVGDAAAGSLPAKGDEVREEGNDLRWEKSLLDDRERERVLKHCELVVQCGGIPWLVRLCASADGPLEERDPNFDPAASGKKGKGKKAKKKGKKAKLEPGMQEAHVYASGCLRLLSLVPENKPLLMEAGAHRYMAHLLDCNVDLSRWHARQTLLNLAMVPEFAQTLSLYEFPFFVTGANLPKPPVSACRPQTAPAALEGGAGTSFSAGAQRPPMTAH